ncbi:hypothetical protein Tco_1540982, partial [Tanacetum coccineum]
KKNQGTVTRIKTDDNRVFEMLFIAIGASIRPFLNYLRPVLMIDDAHLKGLYKGTNLVAVAMDGNNQTVPISFGICKGETGLFWKICKAYTREDYATNMNILQTVQPDAYEKLCQAGPQRWSRAHCLLVRYNYMISNSVESVNACSVIYRKEPVLKLAETYPNMTYEITYWAANKVAKKRMKSETWVVKGVNEYQYQVSDVAGKLQIFVSHTPIDFSTVLIPNNGSLEESLAAQYKLEIYIDHIGVDFVISKYIFPNASLAEMMNHVITDYSSENEGIIRQETQNDYTFDKMVEWAEQEHFEYEETKTSHTISPISTMLSSTIESCLSYTHFFSPLTYYMAYGENKARQAIVLKLQREIQAEETLADQLLCNLTCYTEEMRIRSVQITMLQSMPTTSLNTYGLHALLMTHEADIRTTNIILRTRQQLLRSISAKQNFINNYMAI